MAYTKLIQTGNILEVYRYEKEPANKVFNRIARHSPAEIPRPRSRVLPRRRDSVMRASKSFRKIISGNLSQNPPALLTLTMLDTVDIRNAYKCYTSFGHKIRRAYGKNVSWIAVPEFQSRGAVHFHILIWNLPYEIVSTERVTRNLQNKWRYGYVDILETDGSQKLASYLSKYMSKAMSDSRLAGVKAYSATRNLMRPVSINSPSAVDFILEDWGITSGDNLPVRERTYGTVWLGRADYKKYQITYENNLNKSAKGNRL